MSDKNPVLPPKAKLKAPSFTFNLSNDSPVTVGNKPKPKFKTDGKKLLTAKGLVVHLNLRPSINTHNGLTTSDKPKAKLYAIPIREHSKQNHNFIIKLDLPEQENPFYETEARRQTFIQEQLKDITEAIGLTFFNHIDFEEWISLVEEHGWTVYVSLESKQSPAPIGCDHS